MWNKRVSHFGPFAAFEAAALLLLFATPAIAVGTKKSGRGFWRRFASNFTSSNKSLVEPENAEAILQDSNKWFLKEKSLPETKYLERTTPLGQGLQLYVDFDDTLAPGRWLSKDELYPEGVPYPGATQLLYEISKRGDGTAFLPRLITARSDVDKDVSVLRELKEAGKRNGGAQSWAIDLDKSLFMSFPGKLVRRGSTKATFLEQRLADDGEIIVFGDNGDDDERTAARLAKRDEVKAFFVHTVVAKPPKPISNSIYFRSYIDAAFKAMEQKFISDKAFRNVVVQAYQDMIEIMVEPTGGHRCFVLVFHHLLPDFISALKKIFQDPASEAQHDRSLRFVLHEVVSFMKAMGRQDADLDLIVVDLGDETIAAAPGSSRVMGDDA